jgi:hypothetical protein
MTCPSTSLRELDDVVDDELLRFESAGRTTAAVIASILRVCFSDAQTAVDLTPGHGGFWTERIPIRVLVTRSSYDFTALPYANESFDVALFDPPHLADAGTSSIMGSRYGTYRTQQALEQAVRKGTGQAWRIARLGVVIKVCDHVHGSRLVRMSRWIDEVLCELGGQPYEVVHQLHRPLIDPRWREPQLSARNNGSSYLIFRKDSPIHRRRRSSSAASAPQALRKKSANEIQVAGDDVTAMVDVLLT